jgi:hypothetical protein
MDGAQQAGYTSSPQAGYPQAGPYAGFSAEPQPDFGGAYQASFITPHATGTTALPEYDDGTGQTFAPVSTTSDLPNPALNVG